MLDKMIRKYHLAKIPFISFKAEKSEWFDIETSAKIDGETILDNINHLASGNE